MTDELIVFRTLNAGLVVYGSRILIVVVSIKEQLVAIGKAIVNIEPVMIEAVEEIKMAAVVETAASRWSPSGRVNTTLGQKHVVRVESGGEELVLQRLVDTWFCQL